MQAPVRYLSYLDFTLGKVQLIMAFKKLKHIPASGKDYRLCSDPEDYFGFTDYEYDILDSDRKLANHYKSKLNAHQEEILFHQACEFLLENRQTYCRNGITEETL